MDEVSRTLDAYSTDADAYVEKYRSESVAARYGAAFRDAVEGLDGERVLDVGCGPGADVETFLNTGYDVTGLDLTPGFLQAAADRHPEASFVHGDMRRLPFDEGTFDGLWSSASFLHVPRAEAAGTLREFRRVLRPESVVYLSVKSSERATHDANDRHFVYYRPEEVTDLFSENGFETTRVETTDNWVAVLAVPN
ncbi:class I SAM-dependent methyltransferase [Halomarina rubra]|uniref:Class I SAM-dependent methyltransferase n=1 Tax=Halomarina rubra TaxID=2071873 RepID=A0ABD6AV14_9EURY|nr:class I SAM-dependent methyltransferase [Halomarina rubra]